MYRTGKALSDLKGMNNPVAQEYGIRAIPQNLLLDPNGIIIDKTCVVKRSKKAG